MENQPCVTVIIPSYLRPEQLLTAVHSVERQSYRNRETVVVDDADDEATREAVARHTSARYLAQRRAGAPAARNAGLSVADSEFVASLDHDDEWDAEYLARAMGALERHHADLVWMNFRQKGAEPLDDYLRSLPKGFWRPPGSPPSHLMSTDEFRRFLLFEGGPRSNSALVYRKAVLDGGWVEAAQVMDDFLLMAKLLANPNLRCAIVTDVSWTKEVSEHNHSRWSQTTLRRQIDDVTLALEQFGPAYDPEGQRELKHKLANMNYKFAYHLWWEGERQEAAKHFSRGWQLVPMTRESVRLAGLLAIRTGCRALRLPSRWWSRSARK